MGARAGVCFPVPTRSVHVTSGDPIATSLELVRRALRQSLTHLNDPPQSLQQVLRLVRGQPVLVQQRENVVDDLVLGLGEEVRLREGRLRNAGTGILAAKLGDDVVEVLLRAEALPLQEFDNRGDLPHVGDRRFFDGHAVAFGTVVAHGRLSAGSCTNRVT